jgi:HD-like signal output (HDOD) protein
LDIFEKIIQSVDEFPTLPTIYSALSDVLANPNSTFTDAADVISRDQSSAAKILKTANSSFYGFPGRIDTITQAIFYIGFEEVRNMILTLAIMDMFKKTSAVNNFNPVELWKHSIAVGIITRSLGKIIGIDNIENCFISGIIHDIGKLLFIKYLEKEYTKALNYANDNKINIRDAEAEILGITHTIAGELIAEKWKLPNTIKKAIRYHYSGVVDGKVDKLASCVHIGNIAARMLEFGNSGDSIYPEPYIEVWNVLKFPDNTFSMLLPTIEKDYLESLSIFTIK